jgi:colicin import membrane protein
LYLSQDDHLNSSLVKAVVIHIFIVLTGITLSYLFDLNSSNLKVPSDIDIVQSAIKIDLVAMPTHTLKELEKIKLAPPEDTPEPEVIKNEPKKKLETSKIVLKVKTKKVNVSDLLKQFSQKTVVTKKKNKKKKFNDKALRKLVLEGNKLSQGSSTTGESIDEANHEFVSYIQSLPGKVRPWWKLPSYLLGKNLRCRIRVFLAANGAILRTEVFESSGDSEFDKKAIEALKKSSPLPKPTSSILSRVVSGDVILGFPL